MKRISNICWAISCLFALNAAWGAGSPQAGKAMPDAVRAAAVAAIKQQFSAQYRQLDLQPYERAFSEWPTDFDQLTVVPLRSATLAPRQCVTVQAWEKSRLVGANAACFTVRAPGVIWAAKYDIARGAEVRANDYESIAVDLLRNRSALIASSELPLGKRLRVSLRMGQALTRNALDSMPHVVRNQEISLLVLSGNIALETRAVALGDGEQGKSIPVRLLASNDRMTAMVEAKGLAIMRIR